MKLLADMVSISSTWSDGHFRIADGFGTAAAKKDSGKVSVRKMIIGFLEKIINTIKSWF